MDLEHVLELLLNGKHGNAERGTAHFVTIQRARVEELLLVVRRHARLVAALENGGVLPGGVVLYPVTVEEILKKAAEDL